MLTLVTLTSPFPGYYLVTPCYFINVLLLFLFSVLAFARRTAANANKLEASEPDTALVVVVLFRSAMQINVYHTQNTHN